MFKKFILLSLGTLLFLACNKVEARVVLNEVKLSPTEDRFVELYNEDNSEVDLTGWYIQRKTLTGSSFNSLASNTNFENKKIGPKGYFLISRVLMDKADIVLGNLTLTESNTLQIKNASGEIVDKFCFGEVLDCDQMKVANPPEGESVSRGQDGTLFVGVSTPRAQNYVSPPSSEPVVETNVSVSGASSSASTPSTQNTKTAEVLKIKTKIISKMITFPGVPVEFSADTRGHSNEKIFSGKYFWNFGDGDSKEMKLNDIGKFAHTFFYEGEYTVILEYYRDFYSEEPEAIDKITIKVIPNNVVISNVGDENDFFIEISNDTNYDADISRWILSGNNKTFIFPKNMILGSKKKIVLSPKITNFSILDKDSLKLLNSQWETVFDYASFLKPEIKIKNFISKEESSKTELIGKEPIVSTIQNPIVKNKIEEAKIPVDNLLARASKSDVGVDYKNDFIYWIFLFVFLGSCTTIVYFVRIRNRKLIQKTVIGDFEILDE